MRTYGDWFSGFGGMTIGAMWAGFKPVFACEYDAEIAAVYANNLGNHVTVADLLTLDNGISHPNFPRTKNGRKRRLQDMQGDWFRRVVARGAKHGDFEFATPHFPHVDWKHDSPPCPEFSVAKAGGQEGLREIALAVKCCEYLIYARPRFYSLENVYGYRNSESFQLILKTLYALGYGVGYWHLNAADYGVPQTRKRLILMAHANGRKPQKPRAAHESGDKKSGGFVGSLFGDSFDLKPWVGWHEAVGDLLHSLPDSQFADWQLRRLPKEFGDRFLAHIQANSGTDGRWGVQPATTLGASKQPDRALLVHGTNGNGLTVNNSDDPAAVVVASLHEKTAVPKAFLVHGTEQRNFRPYEDNPAPTVKAQDHKGMPRALLVGDQRSHNGVAVISREEDCPAYVVDTRPASKNRAIILNGTPNTHGATVTSCAMDEPVFTMTASVEKRPLRAFLSDRLNSSSKPPNRYDDQPVMTVTCYSDKHQVPNALANDRVVQMTVRASARLQSFPDWYRFPVCEQKQAERHYDKYFINGERPLAMDKFMVEHVITNRSLSCRGIGNAVPPLLGMAIGKAW